MSPLSNHGTGQHPCAGTEAPDTLGDCIAEYSAWVDYNFGTTSSFEDRTKKAQEQFLGVVEEVGELSHSILKQLQTIRGTHEEHDADQRDAVADIVIFLMGFCYRKGWSLEQIILETWKDVRLRDWIKYPKTGKEVYVD